MVIDVAKNNSIVSGSRDLVYDVGVPTGTNTCISFNFEHESGVDLPTAYLTPAVKYNGSVAINTSATLRGVLEEHNGVKFKMINAAGSFGVWAAVAERIFCTKYKA